MSQEEGCLRRSRGLVRVCEVVGAADEAGVGCSGELRVEKIRDERWW